MTLAHWYNNQRNSTLWICSKKNYPPNTSPSENLTIIGGAAESKLGLCFKYFFIGSTELTWVIYEFWISDYLKSNKS